MSCRFGQSSNICLTGSLLETYKLSSKPPLKIWTDRLGIGLQRLVPIPGNGLSTEPRGHHSVLLFNVCWRTSSTVLSMIESAGSSFSQQPFHKLLDLYAMLLVNGYISAQYNRLHARPPTPPRPRWGTNCLLTTSKAGNESSHKNHPSKNQWFTQTYEFFWHRHLYYSWNYTSLYVHHAFHKSVLQLAQKLLNLTVWHHGYLPSSCCEECHNFYTVDSRWCNLLISWACFRYCWRRWLLSTCSDWQTSNSVLRPMWPFWVMWPQKNLSKYKWVCRFLTAHQHIKGYSVPCNG